MNVYLTSNDDHDEGFDINIKIINISFMVEINFRKMSTLDDTKQVRFEN